MEIRKEGKKEGRKEGKKGRSDRGKERNEKRKTWKTRRCTIHKEENNVGWRKRIKKVRI